MSQVYKPMRVGATGDCRCGYGMRVCNPHSTRTHDMGLTGIPAFAGQCDQVTWRHNLVWFPPTTTSTHLAPNCNQPPTHAPPLWRGMWACLILLDWGIWQEEHKGGPKWEAQLVSGVSREWAMTHGPFLLIPLFWTPTNALSTSFHIGCIDPTMHTSLQTR